MRFGDRVRVLAAPSDAHPPPPLLECLLRGHLEVLPHDLELPTGVEVDEVARDRAYVPDVADLAALHAQAGGRVGVAEDPHLLGADREARTVALDDVRHTHE